MKIPKLYLITGFLGSGKTSLIKNILYKRNGKLIKIDTVMEMIHTTDFTGKYVRDKQKLIFISKIGIVLINKLVQSADKHLKNNYKIIS